jgi:uncharacterized delta-60 repeat protein
VALLAGVIVFLVGPAQAASNSGAEAVAIQSDGRIVAAGWGDRGFATTFGLARYQPNGSLDTSFGRRGIVTTPIGKDAQAKAGALQPDGKIVVAGHGGGYFSSRDFAVARYLPTGALDASFGKGGTVRTAFGSAGSEATAVAIQTNGKIVAAGYTQAGTKYKFALARYLRSGALDTTFGSGGLVTTNFGSSGIAGVAIQTDGKIVAVGSSSGKFALARYNSDGSLDTGFGLGGKVTTSILGKDSAANAVALQPNGKIVVAGSARSGVGVPPTSKDSFALARYNSDGSLDMVSLTVFIDFECDLCGAGANAVALQPDGKIVLAGQETSGGRGQFALARFEPDGTLDVTFGSGGTVTTSFGFPEPANGTSGDSATSLALQKNGRIVAAGFSKFGPHTEQYLFAMARYRANGSLDTTFGKGGKVNTSVATCVVPNVKGQKLVYAGGRIRRSHCAVGTVKYVFSSRVTRKHVISQKPKPKKVGVEGTKVNLVVSKGR